MRLPPDAEAPALRGVVAQQESLAHVAALTRLKGANSRVALEAASR